MYAVIFRAETNEVDGIYTEMASHLRTLALEKYNCSEFTSVTEGSHEISISYWENQDQIKEWKKDIKHLEAQKLGNLKWYKHYKVQVVEIIREYEKST